MMASSARTSVPFKTERNRGAVSNRTEFEEFLMFNLKEINECITDVYQRTFALITTLAVGGDTMPESLFLAYVEDIDIPFRILYTKIAYLHGMGYFEVTCDCNNFDCMFRNIASEPWYDSGVKELQLKSDEYMIIGNQISDLSQELGF